MGRRYSVRSGGGSTAWPGTSAQLASGSGTAISTAGRLTVSGSVATTAGARIAPDANTILAYYCNETAGTTITNYGTLASADATIAGTYRLGDLGLYAGGTPAIRLAGVAGTTILKTGISTGALTAASLELVCMLGVSSATTQAMVVLNDNTASPNTHGFQIFTASGTLYCGASTTSFANATVAIPSYYSRMHIGMSWDGSLGSNNISMYINGALVAQATKSGTMNSLTKLAIGCDPASALQMSGVVADVRLSNIARSQSYFIDAAKAAGAL